MNRADGIAWLREFLGSDVKSSLEVIASARDAGLGQSGLNVARGVLETACFRKEPMGPFFMCLPEVDHKDYFNRNPGGDVGDLTDEHRAVSLVKEWRASRNGSSARLPDLIEQVEWVAEVSLLPMSLLKVSEVPCGSALSLLLYAKDDPVGFRQLYHAKLMPIRSAVPAPKVKVVKKRKGGSEAGGQDAIDRLLKRSKRVADVVSLGTSDKSDQ